MLSQLTVAFPQHVTHSYTLHAGTVMTRHHKRFSLGVFLHRRPPPTGNLRPRPRRWRAAVTEVTDVQCFQVAALICFAFSLGLIEEHLDWILLHKQDLWLTDRKWTHQAQQEEK